MQEVYENIYQILVPLPDSPLKVLNCYVIKGPERNLIIDTGFNLPESEESLFNGLRELDIDLDKTDIFITHLHSDHSGLADKLKTPSNQVLVSEVDGRIMLRNINDAYWDYLIEKQILIGFPTDKRLDKTDHPGYANRLEKLPDLTFISVGEILQVGNYHLEVVDLKGHTPGQIGLFDWEKGILFSGDHVLCKITPNINFWDRGYDDLGAFLDNLQKLKKMPVRIIFPAHRQIIMEPLARVNQLLKHHAKRLNHIIQVLNTKNSTMYEIAAGIPWDFAGGQFLKFPLTQQWFAANEVYAHMEHLEQLGQVKKYTRPDGAYVYEKLLEQRQLL